MAELDYDALQRLADAATPGPWLVDTHHWGKGVMDDDGDQLFIESHGLTYALFAADAEFIAAARAAVPALLDRVRELEAGKPECDGGCSYGDGPQEECSAHGRTPRDLWGIIGDLIAERDAALSTIAKVGALHVPGALAECQECEGNRWPCPTIRALGSVPSTGEGNE